MSDVAFIVEVEMDKVIYSSNNESGLLKSVGPYRLFSSDNSFAGHITPKVVRPIEPIVFGTKKVFGEKVMYHYPTGFDIKPSSGSAEKDDENL